MADKAIFMYTQAIKSLESAILGKRATIRLLANRYTPARMWDHGHEFVRLENEIGYLEKALEIQKAKLKTVTTGREIV